MALQLRTADLLPRRNERRHHCASEIDRQLGMAKLPFDWHRTSAFGNNVGFGKVAVRHIS